MAGTTIYSTVVDLTSTADSILQLGGGYDVQMLAWLNEGQLEMESEWRLNGMVYDALRVNGQSGSGKAIAALVAGTSDYSFASATRIAAIDMDTVRDDANPITYRKEEEIRRTLDRAWDDEGRVEHFSLRPNAFKFWRIPNAVYLTSHPIIYFDCFTRFNKFTISTDPLTQFYEHDRLALLRYLEYRAYQQMDDSREDRKHQEFLDLVMRMGSSGNVQGVGGPPIEMSLGPYFDDVEW